MQKERRRHKRLNSKQVFARYIASIGIVVFVLLSTNLFISRSVENIASDEHIINISGMQRMLSQRIALLANRLESDVSPATKRDILSLLNASIRTFESNTADIAAYIEQSKQHWLERLVPSDMLTHITEHYYAPQHNIHGKSELYAIHANNLAKHYQQSMRTNPYPAANYKTSLNYITRQSTHSFVTSLNAAVTAFEGYKAEKLSLYKKIQFVSTAITIGMLLIFTLIVLFPLIKRLDLQVSALEKARKNAEELNRLKSDFLANMSHEIRTPMNGVLGMAELLKSTSLNSQQKNYTNTIINSGESLLNIINDILDFSKIESGKMELDILPIDLFAIVNDVGQLYCVQASDKAVELILHYQPGSEQFVYADPIRLRQILNNLVSNAIKFTEKGYVTITIAEDKKNSNADCAMVTFSVRDTGIGMTREAASRIFEKFTQADSSTTRHYGGSGLGLSICKSLVNMMGGEITIETAPAQGTTMTFSLYLRRNHSESATTPQLPEIHGKRVLIIDDYDINCTIVQEQLQRIGMHCDISNLPHQALDMMRDASRNGNPYDIALIDYLMPDFNGVMLARAINDYPELRDICLIMLTSAGNPLADDEFVKNGFSAYIAKPLPHNYLANAIAGIWKKYNGGARDTLIRIDQQQTAASSEAEPKVKGKKILLAEDNLINQAYVKEILEEMEALVVIASDGMAAVKALHRETFDLILMDCLMPEMDGFEASRMINQTHQEDMIKSKPPIIALTANAVKGDREKCLAAGMDDYVTKPVKKLYLKHKVFEWITGCSFSNEEVVYETNGDTVICRLHNDNINQSSPTQETAMQIIDMNVVSEAKTLLKDRYDQVLSTFFVTCETYIEDINVAIHEKDVLSVVRPTHTMKSSAAQMGAVKLSIEAKTLEQFAKTYVDCDSHTIDWVVLDSAAKTLEHCLKETQEGFKAQLADHA